MPYTEEEVLELAKRAYRSGKDSVNCFPSLPIFARVSSNAERLVICRSPSCFQTPERNLGVAEFPSKVTTAERAKGIVERPLQLSHSRRDYWAGALPGAFLLHLPRSLTDPRVHVRVLRP